jgi:RecA-family ATPase
MKNLEIEEAEGIHKEEALRRISAMIKRYGITLADLREILPDAAYGAIGRTSPESKLFDPFFDVR